MSTRQIKNEQKITRIKINYMFFLLFLLPFWINHEQHVCMSEFIVLSRRVQPFLFLLKLIIFCSRYLVLRVKEVFYK